MKILRWLVIPCICGMVVGCASSAVIVTGIVRPSVNIADVRIVSKVPDNAEEIAIIKSSSDAGFTEQKCYDYAVNELKARAARMGGNAVLIESVGSNNDGYVYCNGVAVPNTSHFLVGKAFYIPVADKVK